jgi:alpha-glucosidase (family GH31 glycosyl hydrolase)
LDRYRDFTYDPIDFEKLPEFIDNLHKKNMHYIPILDAGIAQRLDDSYEAYTDGASKDIFVKTGDGSEILTVEVWPAESAFPDFFNPDA